MSEASMAALARDLAKAMVARARTRSVEDTKVVLDLQTQLVAEYFCEKKTDAESLVLN